MKNSIYFLTLLLITLCSCSSDDDSNEQQTNQAHIIEFTTGILNGSVTVDLTTTLYYEDGSQETVTSDFDHDNNEVSVVIPENTTNFELEFYIEDSSPANMRFFGAENNETLHQETTSGQLFEYEYSFQ